MTSEACEIKHKQIENKFREQDTRLKCYDEELSRLSQSSAVNSTQITDLCKRIDGLVKALWGLFGIGITAVIAYILK